ncbi:class I SAM-dependent methyltransferase [Agrobacterium sp. FDAARGOS_525]|uniref:class I SAM-dependent methyltransferase n=1 Tax=Agrobacterium sp. FDAARGOS_525 TaxID=2420311 RepID=UPI000F68974D|nr:CmcI family methyltransferase [Agrobacterium sp. FDAARGOS_525]RSC38579.1 class I SAM-dependent methyltransferase [Agrobacterium sp. FDAARGOS_525]
MSDGFLHRYFLNNGHKRLHKWMHYFDAYEHHFERFRGKKPTVLEIGVFGGGSLAMWKDYFGDGANILGLDIDAECKAHEAEGIKVYIGSQDDPQIIQTIIDENPQIDIVIDDGSHRMDHVLASFNLLYERISPKGIYFVEDTHTCYWPEYQGGLGNPKSFMEFTKTKLDEINAVHTRGAVETTTFTRSTRSITIYDSICVFEKAPQGKRQTPITEPL